MCPRVEMSAFHCATCPPAYVFAYADVHTTSRQVFPNPTIVFSAAFTRWLQQRHSQASRSKAPSLQTGAASLSRASCSSGLACTLLSPVGVARVVRITLHHDTGDTRMEARSPRLVPIRSEPYKKARAARRAFLDGLIFEGLSIIA